MAKTSYDHRVPSPEIIRKIIAMNRLFDGDIYREYGRFTTAIMRDTSSLLLDTLMRPENIRKNEEIALHDKHRDGGIAVNCGVLRRDVGLPLGSTKYWGFAEDTRPIGDITSSVSTKSTICSLAYALYALQEDTKHPSSLESPFDFCDTLNDSREGSIAFLPAGHKLFMNNGFTMTDRRITDLRTALGINNIGKWISTNFGESGDGGGIQAVIFGSLYDVLINDLVFDNKEYVIGMRISAESKDLLILPNYFDGSGESRFSKDQRLWDRVITSHGYVGLNRGKYLIARLNNKYRKILKSQFNEVDFDPLELTNNQVNTHLESAVIDTTARVGIDPIYLFDIVYGEVGLCDLNTFQRRSGDKITAINTKKHKVRGFSRYDNVGMYLRQRQIT